MQRSRKGQRMRGFLLQFLPSRCHARVSGKKIVYVVSIVSVSCFADVDETVQLV